MADETIINGVASEGDDQAADNYYDLDDATKVSDLNRKIEGLEQEKLELVRENEVSGQKIKKLTAEIAGMRNDEAKIKERMEILETEVSEAESGKKALEAIAARAADLETEVVRLQHDLISAMSDGDEANAEVRELKKVLVEKESSLESIEKEQLAVKQWLEREVEAKAISESKVCELEKRIEGMQERESEMKREKERIDGEAKARIDEKEREISGLKKRIEELEAVVAKNVLELEKEKNEKKEMKAVKNGIEVLLRASEVKVKEMETKMIQLQKEAEKAITGLKEKTVEAVNGIVTKTGLDDESKGVKGLNLQWPAVAATATGTIVVAGVVCYLHYGRRRVVLYDVRGLNKANFPESSEWKWKLGPSMIVNHRINPTRTTIHGKLYIAGGARVDPPKPWGEFLDPKLDKCQTLPHPPPPVRLDYTISPVFEPLPQEPSKKTLVGFEFGVSECQLYGYDATTNNCTIDYGFRERWLYGHTKLVDNTLYWFDNHGLKI